MKRWFGAGAGLLAGAMLAVTPVAALMFRFNNPDALLVCLLVASAYCLVRALEGGSTRWMVGVGTLIGFAFLAKMMQAFLVVPGFALVYLIAAPTAVRRRIWQLLAGGAAMVVSAGWWVAIVALWPASSRPMIDGSSDNSILNLIVGYNGLGRLTGSGGGPAAGAAAELQRRDRSAAPVQRPDGRPGVMAAAGRAAGRRRGAGVAAACTAHGPDPCRDLLWGGWLVVSGLVFSLSAGVIHTYYTVALAPAIAALVAIGAALAWRRRDVVAARALLALGVVVTAVWAIVLLGRTPSLGAVARAGDRGRGRRAAVGLLMPPRAGAAAECGGAVHRARRLPRGAGGVLGADDRLGAHRLGPVGRAVERRRWRPGGGRVHGGAAGSFPGAGGGFSARVAARVRAAAGLLALRPRHLPGRRRGPLAVRRLVARCRHDRRRRERRREHALVAALKSGASGYRWAAATSGSQSAASLELATGGVPVMAIGGFSGQGGNLSLAQFEAYVKAGDIHYYIASGAVAAASAAAPVGPAAARARARSPAG